MTTRATIRRGGMTLVELLVVMVIILILATIVVAFAPGFQDAQKAARGADQLQMWLVSARQMAKSARAPTGLRLIINNGQVNELQYIQQPPTYTVPFAVPAQPPGQQPVAAMLGVSTSAGVSTVTLNMPTTGSMPPILATQQPGDFSGGGFAAAVPQQSWPVQAGDYLVIHGTICSVGAIGPPQNPNWPQLCNQLTLANAMTGNLATIQATSDYYFVRAPRPLSGETTLKLPQDVVIDMTQSLPPAQKATGTLDIVFSPSGEIISNVFNPSTIVATSPTFQANNKLIFWVMDPTKPAGNTQDTLIAVDIRTGLVAAQPVNIGGADPYLYTKDGRTSGL